MKLALIGNCQVTPMKALIEASLPGVTCTAWEVFAMTEADCAKAAEALLRAVARAFSEIGSVKS